mmetsp:Transcript_38826/g.107982  ORF Transcript_38826/g.107982 Transcript_38826/m.107982 type:complete len:234 (+) Transcript_38826:599-1300(+)
MRNRCPPKTTPDASPCATTRPPKTLRGPTLRALNTTMSPVCTALPPESFSRRNVSKSPQLLDRATAAWPTTVMYFWVDADFKHTSSPDASCRLSVSELVPKLRRSVGLEGLDKVAMLAGVDARDAVGLRAALVATALALVEVVVLVEVAVVADASVVMATADVVVDAVVVGAGDEVAIVTAGVATRAMVVFVVGQPMSRTAWMAEWSLPPEPKVRTSTIEAGPMLPKMLSTPP